MANPQVVPVPIRTLTAGLQELCGTAKTQSGEHIKAIHQHCADRLALEGGFRPEWLHPTPPLKSTPKTNREYRLSVSQGSLVDSEQTVFGGIKGKNIDVTVDVPGLGPSLGISAKSTGNAFRNLTNRMEEALGDCANIHMMYPGFVFGFLHFIKFAKVGEVPAADASFGVDDKPLQKIIRYHSVLTSLSGRTSITDPPMRYESVGLVVYKCDVDHVQIWPHYPPADSPVYYLSFFQRLYDMYDLRYAYPDESGKNYRKTWALTKCTAPVLIDAASGFGWELRLHDEEEGAADETPSVPVAP
jgi:hypothetical protein